jgi:hypothetical protein
MSRLNLMTLGIWRWQYEWIARPASIGGERHENCLVTFQIPPYLTRRSIQKDAYNYATNLNIL